MQTECMDAPTPTELAGAAQISVPYASQILNDHPKHGRIPPPALAVHIFRSTGWRHPSIAALTDEQLNGIEAVTRWTPRRIPTERVAA